MCPVRFNQLTFFTVSDSYMEEVKEDAEGYTKAQLM
jgi:hypothetical protein